MLRNMIDHFPELKDWEVHWLLANLRFDAVYDTAPGNLSVKIINDGFADSTACDIVARVVEVERGNGPDEPMLIRYRHPERVKRLRALAVDEREDIHFGYFSRQSDASDILTCVVIDPATDAHPFGEIQESNKQDNTICEWYEVYGPVPREDPPSQDEPTIEDPLGGDPPPYRLYRRIV